MSNDKKIERSPERPSEADSVVRTTAKLAGESISDEQQAVAYEPKFKSFSGHAGHGLPQAEHAASRAARDGAATDSHSSPTDWFGQLMNRIHSRSLADAASSGVAEFVLEDKDAGKEHTAKGERYVARPSYLQGLQAQLKEAKSEAEAEQIQSFFSIEYMLQKARQIGSAAMAQLGMPAETPGDGKTADAKPADATFTNYDDFEASVAHRHGLTDATLIGANPNGDPNLATDAVPPGGKPSKDKPSDSVQPRRADLGSHGTSEESSFPSPPDVVTVLAPGKPGAVLHQFGVRYFDFMPEKDPAQFVEEVRQAREKILDTYPDAPPLICLDVKDSAEGAGSRPSIASVVAHSTGTAVLGQKADGRFVMFDASGKETPITITDPHSSEQWNKALEAAKRNWSGNHRYHRVPDFDEVKESFTTAPPEVLSISFHCLPGQPWHMNMKELLAQTNAAQQRVIDSYPKSHRTLQKPLLIEMMGCHSSTKPKNSNVESVAAQVAQTKQCWTIGYLGFVNDKTGRSYEKPVEMTGPQDAILFGPDGAEKGRYPTPISGADWQKILKKTTETHK